MLGFRKKILISDLLIFLILISVLFPLVGFTVNRIMRLSLSNRSKVLITELKKAPSTDAMVELMKTRSEFIFQRVSLLDGQGEMIYHTPLSAADESNQIDDPEVREAIRRGSGFQEHMSTHFGEKFYFVAEVFSSHGETFILHVNYRASEIDQLKKDFEIGILVVGILMLVVTSTLDTLIIHHITRPIQKIVNTIRPFKEGKEEFLPRIVLNEAEQGGEFSTLASLLNELTERIQKQIETLTRQREETEEILESIGEGIIATDTSARVTFVNKTACRMLGVSPDTLMKQTLNSIKAPGQDLPKKCHELVLFALQTSEPIVQTWTIREANPIHLDLIATPLAHKNGTLIVLQDKTSDYKIVELGKDFISNASHELRTPITIIRGFAETLQDIPNISPEMLKEITDKIVRTCVRLDKLVRSLLTLSDIENLSPDRLKPADLVLIAEGCKHLLLTAHPKVHITFKTDLESAPIIADADLLELAILNILENAVKYSQPPAHIEMHLFKAGEQIHLSIQDQGIGISEKDLPYIFDRFYTVDKARSRKSGGAGLGLSIVKTIIDKHRGKVSVVSELGKGTTFTITL